MRGGSRFQCPLVVGIELCEKRRRVTLMLPDAIPVVEIQVVEGGPKGEEDAGKIGPNSGIDGGAELLDVTRGSRYKGTGRLPQEKVEQGVLKITPAMEVMASAVGSKECEEPLLVHAVDNGLDEVWVGVVAGKTGALQRLRVTAKLREGEARCLCLGRTNKRSTGNVVLLLSSVLLGPDVVEPRGMVLEGVEVASSRTRLGRGDEGVHPQNATENGAFGEELLVPSCLSPDARGHADVVGQEVVDSVSARAC